MYKILLKKRAKKFIDKLPMNEKRRVVAAIERLPQGEDIKRLKGVMTALCACVWASTGLSTRWITGNWWFTSSTPETEGRFTTDIEPLPVLAACAQGCHRQ